MVCRICGSDNTIVFYLTHMMAMCRPCHAQGVQPIPYADFDDRYWSSADDVPCSTRKEFYSDYKTSGLSFERYCEETTNESW